MAEAEHPLDEVLALMERTELWLVDLPPDTNVTPTYGLLVAGSLLSDCLALHKSIRLLLAERLCDEAGVLLRKLMEDSVVLIYLGGTRGRLEELSVQFLYSLTKKELALWLADQQVKGDEQAAAGAKAVHEQLKGLRDEWKAMGNEGKVPAFPQTDALLERMGQSQGRPLLVRGHLYAHTSRMGLEGRLNERRDAIQFDTHTDPNRGVQIGATATSVLLGAGLGAAGALNWPDDKRAAIEKTRSDLEPKLTPLLRAARAALSGDI